MFRRAERLWRKTREALRIKKPVKIIHHKIDKRAHIPSGAAAGTSAGRPEIP
jgi:hypothetical protein